MTITLADVIGLEAFNTFQLLAGEKGLQNRIGTVGMMDYEMGDTIDKNFGEGELVLTTLVNIKDDLEALDEIVSRLIKVRAAGLAIKNIYIDSVPEKILEHCEAASFPIFMYKDAFFEVLISEVRDFAKSQTELEEIEIRIDQLLAGDLNHTAIKQSARQLHRHFGEYVTVVYIKRLDDRKGQRAFESLRQLETLEKGHKGLIYRGGILLICSDESASAEVFERHKTRCFEQLGILGIGETHRMGMSKDGHRLETLDVGIQEALYACQTAETYALTHLAFKDMGLDRLLLPIKDNPWAMSFCETVMEPLRTYDQKQGTDLLKTAVVYILSSGDVKLTAERLFQHTNTIRYRMERVKQLVSAGRNEELHTAWSFYEMLAVGVRLHLIYTGNLQTVD